MILINTLTRESWFNCYPTFAALKIGVNPETAKRWKRSGAAFVKYNEWEMYFYPEEVKQCKGFNVKK